MIRIQSREPVWSWILFGLLLGFLVEPTKTDELVDWINVFRKEYRDSILITTRYEIQELIYDEPMCNEMKNEKYHGKYRFASFDLMNNYTTELNDYLTLSYEEQERINKLGSSIPYLEMIVPLQKRACCSWAGKQTEISCVFGPETTLNSLKKLNDFCDYGYKKVDGLCKVIDPLIKSNAPSGSDWDNLKDIIRMMNRYRGGYAKFYKISNMHELILDQAICERAGKLTGKPSTWEGVYSTFRWTIFDVVRESGQRQSHYLNFNEMHINKMNGFDNRWLPELENILPRQKKFCCVPKMIEGFDEKQYLCLFEPEGSFSSWNEPRSEPGTRCDEDYIYDKDEGLCTLLPTKMGEVDIAMNDPTTTTEIPIRSSTKTLFETSTAAQQKSNSDSNEHTTQNNDDPPATESPAVTPAHVPKTTDMSINPLNPPSVNQPMPPPDQGAHHQATPKVLDVTDLPAKTTTTLEVDKKIKKYKETETDGDEIEVEQFEEYDDSSNAIPIMITVVFVVVGFL